MRSLSLVLLLVMGRQAFAFCLAPQLLVSDEYYVSQLVFTGVVLSAHHVGDPNDVDFYTGTHYRLRVDHWYRGTHVDYVTLYSENSTARFEMEKQHRYLIFANKTEEGWFVDNCGNSVDISKSTAALNGLKKLPLHQSFIYGDVFPYSGPMTCDPMQLTVHSANLTKTATVRHDCSFRLDVPPGDYSALLVWKGATIPAYDDPYKNSYCFTVPAGGSAGLAFRPIGDADQRNREMIANDDLRLRNLCKNSATQ